MNIYSHFNLTQIKNTTAVALGYFDGVHLGHRKVIEKAVADSIAYGHESAVFTFSLPNNLSVKGQCILELDEKSARIDALGVKHLLIPDFNSFCNFTPNQFVQEILVKTFNAKEVYCGNNFTFGAKKSGDSSALIDLCAKHGIHVNIVEMAMLDGEPVSSTRIRTCLQNGEIEKANGMLCLPYSICKEVVKGKGLGHTLSVPTINQIFEPNMLMPKGGVYATRTLIDGKYYPSATGIGERPTVNGEGITCETFIKGLNTDLYGKKVRVEFVKYLAPTQRFDNLNQLKECIINAAEQSEKLFNKSIY